MSVRLMFLLGAGVAMAAQPAHWANLSLNFEPDGSRYVARGGGYTIQLTSGGMTLGGKDRLPLRLTLLAANPAARSTAEDLQQSTTNYFVGKDPSAWRTAVPNYGGVRYTGLYPGIDLLYYGKEGTLEYDWIVSPGADPRNIRMRFDGADRVRIDRRGDLVLQQRRAEYRHKRPVVYQQIAGKRVPIAGAWVLHGKQAAFRIGAYDREQTLVIDPPLIYSTYQGGSGLDFAYAVAIDPVGNTYVTGGAGSTNFPNAVALQGSLRGAEDVFVTKINPAGTARVFSTYLGGGGPDEGRGIAVDGQENVYVTGSAGSLDFPVKSAIQSKWGGSGDAFLTKLDRSGSSIVYSTYLGGGAIDYGTAVAVDPAGNACVVGITFSTDFPTVNPFQAVKGAQQDAFVARINAAGSAWIYATYLGGNAVDEGYAIATDAAGNAYVTGYTGSTNFPLQSPIRSSNTASVDAFVTKLNPAGSALVFSTYLGGAGTDYGNAIAVDASGNVYVAGVAGSNDFPIACAMQPKFGGADDAFVTKLNPSGSALVYSTYLGGGSDDQAFALAMDSAGNAWVTGRTNSSDFPLTAPLQASRFAFDMFVTELNAAGSARLFSTFIGGTGSESGRGIAVDKAGNVHIAGETTSTDFPLAHAIQSTSGGGAASQDAVILLLGDSAPPPGPTITAVSDNLIDGGPLVPGAWMYVKGTNLGDTTRIWGAGDFADPAILPTDLNGTEVWINGAPAPVYFISPGQVDAQVPSNANGSVTVQVFHAGLPSNVLTAPVAQISPALYFYSVNSKAYVAGVFLDGVIMGDPAQVGGLRKAKPGDILQVYAAGLMAETSGHAVGSPVLLDGVSVKIGGADVQVLGAALVGPGQFQVNIVTPQLADGEYPITLSSGGKTSQPNILFIMGQ